MKNRIPYLIFFFTLMVFLCIFFSDDKDNQQNLPKITNSIDFSESGNIYEFEKDKSLKTSGSWQISPIKIDDSDPNYNWSKTAEDNDWCYYKNGYYIIENLTIRGNNTHDCIRIYNSNQYFIIRDCTFYGSWSFTPMGAGIKLINTVCGQIISNNCSRNMAGIFISSSSINNIVYNNTIDNCYYGIYDLGDFNKIFNNRLSESLSSSICARDNQFADIWENDIKNSYGSGIYCESSHNCTVWKNTVTLSDFDGIILYSCDDSAVATNKVFNNDDDGLYILGDDNTIFNNTISFHGERGIYLYGDRNDLMENKIDHSSLYGIFIQGTVWGGDSNTLYNNIFIANTINAEDNATNTKWDDGSVGNYWDDYLGKDANDDGLGDSNYTGITGSAGSEDQYPIWWDAPNFTIITPSSNLLFGNSSPSFKIRIHEGINDTMWYSLNTGFTNMTFLYNATIDQNLWNNAANGSVRIIFYVNDSKGWETSREVVVLKDCQPPDITVITPKENEIFSHNPPNVILDIKDGNLNSTWYMLFNSSYNTANYTWEGFISPTVWDDFTNGSITMRFYANDSLGNMAFKELLIFKDIIAPNITIITPKENEIFSHNPPNVILDVKDDNLNSTWYKLFNSSYNTANYTWEGFISPTVWADLGNGTITIRFYANDTAGNIGYEEVTVSKDIIAPEIVINDPKPIELFGKDAPNFDILINEANLNTTWYYLTDGIFQTVNVSFIYLIDTTIMQSIWNQVNGEFITIYFYANDSMGNVDFQSITINKLADYWVLSPFVIDDDINNGAGDYNWTEATVFDWCNGSGTIGDPYFIGNLYINGSGLGSCLTIKDTSKFFIVNNSIFFNSGNSDLDAGIRLINVNNGTISYNNCSLNQNGIVLRNSYYNNLSRNTMNNNTLHGIAVYNSSYNKILYNNETIDYNVLCGIFLNNSHYNNITGNFIRYNDIGICLNSSNYNTITYNLFIGNNRDIVQNNCIKNFIGPNYHEPVPDVDDDDNGKDDPEEISDIAEIIIALVGFIIIVSIIGIILVIVLVKSRGSGKKRKKETDKILEILHDIR